MKKILYLTAVPWRWIKQRPQFLAEALAHDFEVDVYCKRPNRIKKADLINTEKPGSNPSINSYIQLPFKAIPIVRRLPLNWINALLLKLQLPSFKNYDIIWVTSGPLYNLIKANIKDSQILVFDCMDDILEFPNLKQNNYLRKKYLKYETALLNRAHIVFCSAEYLKNKIISRSNVKDEKVVVVNNAIELPEALGVESSNPKVKSIIEFLKENKSLVYIGTIDEWFDMESIMYVLDRNPDLHLVLIGPMKLTKPEHNRIHYLGTVEHDAIYDIMPNAFSLIMPFKLTELILSVNPVKLYEYIYANVPVIATKYGETLKFEPHVHLYDDKERLNEIIMNLQAGKPKIDKVKNQQFVEMNTWHNRYETIKERLLSILNHGK